MSDSNKVIPIACPSSVVFDPSSWEEGTIPAKFKANLIQFYLALFTKNYLAWSRYAFTTFLKLKSRLSCKRQKEPHVRQIVGLVLNLLDKDLITEDKQGYWTLTKRGRMLVNNEQVP